MERRTFGDQVTARMTDRTWSFILARGNWMLWMTGISVRVALMFSG